MIAAYTLPLAAQSTAAAPQLVWHAPEGCPDAAAMRESLRKAAPAARELVMEGAVQQEGARYVLQLRAQVGTDNFERSLFDSDCGALADTAVWLVKVFASRHAVLPPAAAQRKPAEPSPKATDRSADGTRVAVTPREAPAAREPAQPAGPSEPPDMPQLGELPEITRTPKGAPSDDEDNASAPIVIAGMVALGVAGTGLTGAAPELSGALEARRAGLLARLRLGMTYHAGLELQARAGLELQSALLELSTCTVTRFGALRTGPCAVLAGYLTAVEPYGLRSPRSTSALWVNAGGGWHVVWLLHRFVQLTLDVAVTAGLSTRPTFTVGGDSVAQVAPIAGHARVGYSIEIW